MIFKDFIMYGVNVLGGCGTHHIGHAVNISLLCRKTIPLIYNYYVDILNS